MFRESIKKMAPYRPGEQPRPGQRLIKLNTNENPYPPSPRVRRAVAKAIAGSALRLYPAPRADEFVASAARLYSIPQSMILAGNGSDELLAMVFRATLGSGDTVAYPVPTYSLYDTLALVQEARILHFPVGQRFELPLDALADARANLTIVCSPNSPSGMLDSARATSARWRKRLDGRLLVIDEAYVDFAGENALGLVRRHRNIVVLRTLSKSYSLAGMRLGLCFAHPAVIDALMKVKDSYNLSRVALAAGAEALRDSVWMRRNVAESDSNARANRGAAAQARLRGATVAGEFRAGAHARSRYGARHARFAPRRNPGAAFRDAAAARLIENLDWNSGRDGRAVQGARAAGPRHSAAESKAPRPRVSS